MIKEEIEQVQKFYDIIMEFLVTYSFQLLGAIIVFLIGLYVAKKVANIVHKLCDKYEIDITLANFISSVVKIIIIIMVAIICLGKLGISVTPFVATIGALSLGAGLALQGLLSNYGAGITIIVARPFVVGNTISVLGVTGVVKEVSLAHTILTNEEEEEITIPNKHIIGEVLHNSFENSLVEGIVGIAYDTDPTIAIIAIEQALTQDSRFSKVRPPQVGIDEFADSSINIGYRIWVPTTQYYQTKYACNLLVLDALKSQDIPIPFPQREVRMLSS